ncbi:MAG: GPW/gp25 family protein [Novosphingobium sp.]|nr:GPW/gp25 family protein [Novosphingobium sp.]
MTTRAALPYAITATGRTALAIDDVVLEQMLAQIVFVEPGERLNRPSFGCSLRSLVYVSAKSEITGALASLVQSALRQWVGNTIDVLAVTVSRDGANATATITYRDRRTQAQRTVTLHHGGGP